MDFRSCEAPTGSINAQDQSLTPRRQAAGVLRCTGLLAISLLCAALFSLPGRAWAEPVRVDAVTADLLAEVPQVRPGQTFTIGLQLVHDDGWHTYWRNPGDSGLPTQFPVQAPAGVEIGAIQWPIPARMLIPPLANLGFEGETLLMREVTVPSDFQGRTLEFSTLAQWLVCREVCIPGEANLSLRVDVDPDAAPAAPSAAFTMARQRLPAGQLEVPTRIADGALSFQLPADLAATGQDTPHFEYFPYTEGLVTTAAPQQLGRQADGGQWLLQIELAPPLPGLPSEPPTLARATGLIVIDGQRAVEVVAQPAGADAFTGAVEPIASIEGHVVPIFAQLNAADNFRSASASGGSGLLGDLLGGSRGATGSASASVSSAPAGTSAAGFGQPVAAAPAAAGSGAVASLGLAIVFAMIGGLILNLMPCVFPVIGLKILGFAGAGGGGGELSKQARASVRNGSLWFALGVVLAFVALGGLLLILRATGESIGWGFQLQSPVFVVLMALLFIAIGLNFAGLYEVGTSMTQLGNLQQPAAGTASHSASGALGAGVLAVLVATPCTAPFMGSALGFTLAESAGVTMLIFAALGVGMALPYLALGLMPGWLRWLPRPGRWMESLRQLLAFPMFAAAAWLAWVLGLQAGIDAVLALGLAAVVLALGLWVLGRHVQQNRAGSRAVYRFVALALLAGALVLAWPPEPVNSSAGPVAATGASEQRWQAWQADEVNRLVASGTPVFIDFTAAWCISCQVNKRLVLNSEEIQAAFSRAQVVPMRADWTQQDPAISAELARHGRNSVPLYLLYKPGADAPVVLPEILSKSIVLEALQF